MVDQLEQRFEITVQGGHPTITWMHARQDLENDGGGRIVSEAPMEQRSIDPSTIADIVTTIAVVFPAGKAGLAKVKAFVQKIRDTGGEADFHEPGGYL